MKYLLFIFAAVISFPVEAQLVVTEPPFPQTDGSVRIIFDAAEGSGGLAGYSGTVYAHTGVITDQSNGASDWRYVKTNWGQNTSDTRMSRIGEDMHAIDIGPSVREYYGVPAGEEILQIAFVFRSAAQVNGQWLEGKTSSGGDIFVDVYSGSDDFLIQVLRPTQSTGILEVNDTLDLLAFSSKRATHQW
ncbi:MAG: Por secretion system protein, partial [Bacteroidetes bacterium]|nr:Por secretion system protein [Bacteroidota bacterium]